jgi:hypothetical protein
MAITYTYNAQITLQLVLPTTSAGILRNAYDNTWEVQVNNSIANVDAAVFGAFGPNQSKTQVTFGYQESGNQ